MRQLATVKSSRQQWHHKATQRGDRERYQRTQTARLSVERDRTTKARKAAQAPLQQLAAHLRQLAAHLHSQVSRPTVEVVLGSLHRFFVARIGWRAVSRVLRLLAWARGSKPAPCPHTVIKWVTRLARVRTQSARRLEGWPLRQAPFRNGLIWLIASSMGLGTGKMGAVLAVDAPPPQLVPSARSLDRLHCLGVSGAESWPGDTMAAWLDRLIAQMGRPAASLKDGGSALPQAVATLDEQGLASPCLDEIAHAVAGMLQRPSQAHPAVATFLTACGRVSGTLTHTSRACLAPPTVRTTARFLPGHRLVTWAEQGLTLAPAGGAKQGAA